MVKQLSVFSLIVMILSCIPEPSERLNLLTLCIPGDSLIGSVVLRSGDSAIILAGKDTVALAAWSDRRGVRVVPKIVSEQISCDTFQLSHRIQERRVHFGQTMLVVIDSATGRPNQVGTAPTYRHDPALLVITGGAIELLEPYMVQVEIDREVILAASVDQDSLAQLTDYFRDQTIPVSIPFDREIIRSTDGNLWR